MDSFPKLSVFGYLCLGYYQVNKLFDRINHEYYELSKDQLTITYRKGRTCKYIAFVNEWIYPYKLIAADSSKRLIWKFIINCRPRPYPFEFALVSSEKNEFYRYTDNNKPCHAFRTDGRYIIKQLIINILNYGTARKYH